MSAEIERLRAVGRAATEGPWRIDRTLGWDLLEDSSEGNVAEFAIKPDPNAEFCATARNEWDGLLDEIAALRVKVARVEALVEEWEHRYDAGDHMLGCPDGAGYYDLLADEARAALADQSAQDGLSRAGTTSVASGATGDTEGAQRGAQGLEGGKA